MDLGLRRHAGYLSLFFKIINNVHYLFYSKIPAVAVSQQNTKQAVTNRCSTEQFLRTFIPYFVSELNLLPNYIVTAFNLDTFK